MWCYSNKMFFFLFLLGCSIYEKSAMNDRELKFFRFPCLLLDDRVVLMKFNLVPSSFVKESVNLFTCEFYL